MKLLSQVLARPPRVQRLAVEAVPVFFSRHELVEELIAISLVRHGGAISKTRALGTLPSTPVSSDRDRSRGFRGQDRSAFFDHEPLIGLIGPLDPDLNGWSMIICPRNGPFPPTSGALGAG